MKHRLPCLDGTGGFERGGREGSNATVAQQPANQPRGRGSGNTGLVAVLTCDYCNVSEFIGIFLMVEI